MARVSFFFLATRTTHIPPTFNMDPYTSLTTQKSYIARLINTKFDSELVSCKIYINVLKLITR